MGTNRPAIKTIYIGPVTSMFDYRSIVYRPEAKTGLNKLDVKQNQTLRIC